MMLENVSESLNYKDQDLTLDHLVEIQKQIATEENEVHETLCKEAHGGFKADWGADSGRRK